MQNMNGVLIIERMDLFLERISTYIRQSNIATRKMIRSSMDLYAHTRGLQSV